MRKMIRKPKKMGIITRRRIYVPKTTRMETIINVPLDENGQPIFGKVEDERKVFKGYHTYSLVILLDKRKGIIQREVIS